MLRCKSGPDLSLYLSSIRKCVNVYTGGRIQSDQFEKFSPHVLCDAPPALRDIPCKQYYLQRAL